MAGNYKDDKSKVPTEAELEAMLDTESDEDFGQTELEVASVDQRAVLKEWTAQDFANIYTRIRPHLERHARRFLRNPSQVDEVVQDAFLYLMVTLPELDSELGVLRFLKWKVRLLCLDVIRSNSRAFVADIDEHGEFEADMPEMGSDLERAEDAAIVRLALAKLQPRHREVLIASIYEEKSTLEIAGQVGLTENATRQLLLRARTALKKALVGEVNTQGMSINQILSVAAKKAAHDAKQIGAQAMSVIAIAVLGIAAFFNFNISDTPNLAAPNLQQETGSTQGGNQVLEPERLDPTPNTSEQPVDFNGTDDPATNVQQPSDQVEPGSLNDSSDVVFDSALFSKSESLLGSNIRNASIIGGSRTSSTFQTYVQGYSFEVFVSEDASAFVDLDLETGEILGAVLEVRAGDNRYFGYARSSGKAVSKSETGFTTTLVAKKMSFLDGSGRVLAGHALEQATISIAVDLNADLSPKSASISVIP